MPFLVGELGERWYGIWVAVGSLVGSYYLIDFGLATAVQRFVTLSVSRNDPAGTNQVINTALRVYLVLSLVLVVITAVLVLLVPWIMEDPGDVQTVRHVLGIVGITLAVGFPFKAFAGIGQAHNRYDLLTVISITKLVLQVSGTVGVVLAGFGVLGVAYVGLAADLVTDVLLVMLVRYLFPQMKISRKFFRPNMVKALFSYSSWSFVTQIANQIRLRIDGLVVGALLNATAVTHYFVGARLAELASNLLYQATNIVTPILTRYHAEGRQSEMQEAIAFLTRLNIVAGIFVSGSLFALGAPFISTWMGDEFWDATPVLYALTIAMTAGFIVNPIDNLLYAVAKHRVLALINVGDAVANLTLSLLLGRWLGIWGVALGTLVPMLITRFTMVVPYGCRQMHLSVWRYFRQILRTLLVALATVVSLAVSAQALVADGGYARLFCLGACMVLAYSLVAWFLALHQADRVRLMAILRKDRTVHETT